jgi:hypothetical protein
MSARIVVIPFEDSSAYRVEYPGGSKTFRFLGVAQMWCEVQGYKWEIV